MRPAGALRPLGVGMVAVVGAGTMGAGIGQVFAEAQARVRLHDSDPAALRAGHDRLLAGIDRAARKGPLGAGDAERSRELVSCHTELRAAVHDADLVVEAVFEDLAVKRQVWAQIEAAAPETAIFASNTSQIRISSIAAALADPGRLLGTHWFVPAHHMPLVEVAVPDGADEAVVQRVREILGAVGKQTIRCRDAAGFVTSRANMALFAECLRIVEEGVATPEDVDTALRLGLGHAMGPFQVTDLSGADVVLAALDGLRREYGERFEATPGLRRRVGSGQLGHKSGGGFYPPEAAAGAGAGQRAGP